MDKENSNKQPVEEMWLHDVEAIKVFADPLRLEILKLMDSPTTVKTIGEQLDIPPSKLYYHVKLLLNQGLIRVVDHNLETGIVEKIYQVTARQFKLVNPLIAGEDFPTDAADALFTSMLNDTQREFSLAYKSRDKTEGTPPRHPFLTKKSFRLTDAQLTTLHSKLDTLIQEVTALGEENQALMDEDSYALTLVFYQQSSDRKE